MLSHSDIAEKVADSDADAWLVYDYRGSNPVFRQILGRQLFLTRRAFLLLTPTGDPRLLVSRVDLTDSVTNLPGYSVETYTTWQELREWLDGHLAPLGAVAMEYSPHGELPAMSWVDGGTLDLIRGLGVEVVSSAELFQSAAARLTPAGIESHRRAMEHVVRIKDAAFEMVATRLSDGRECSEFEVQEYISDEFRQAGLITDEPPIVAVNAHSGDPHYEPSSDRSAAIRPGDYLLIDLWAKEATDEAVFADITWVGYLGAQAPSGYREVFETVARARDAVIERLRAAGPTPGFELDRVARDVVEAAGHGDAFVHRTGHSLSPGDSVHGLGANLDDLETHDTRVVGPGLAFTVEPGIYLPEFGIRLEINAYMDGDAPVVTSPVQAAPLAFDV